MDEIDLASESGKQTADGHGTEMTDAMNSESTSGARNNELLSVTQQECAERIQWIFNTTLDAVVTIAEDGTVTDWNRQAESIFGWHRAEVLGRVLTDLIIPPRYCDAHRNGLSRFLKSGEGPALNQRLELSALRRNGEEFPIELTISPIRVGSQFEFCAFLRDIGERSRAAEQIALAHDLATRNLAEDAAAARKRAEQAEDRLNLALKSACVGTWSWDVEEDLIHWDDYIPALFGRETGTLPRTYDEFLTMVHPDDQNQLTCAVQRAVEDDVPFDTEYQVLWPDGSIHAVGARGKVYRDELGRALSMTGVCWDITDRERSERALAAANAQLAGVLDASTQVAIIATDINGLITVFNTGAQNLLGYSAEEMIGKQSPGVFHRMDEVIARGDELTRELGHRVEGFEVFVAYAKLGRFDRREWTYVRKDGSQFPVSLVVTAVRNTVGDVTGFLGLAEDITERKNSEERFRAMVEAAPTAMLVVNVSGDIVLINRQVEELFGYQRQELIGRSVEVLMPERFRAEHPALRQQFFRNSVPRDLEADLKLFAVRKDGFEFPVKVGLSPIESAEGQVMICGVMDMSDQQRTLDAIQQAKDAAEASNRAKSSFLANMSHEIRTPMNGIIGMAQLLSQTDLRSHQRDYLATVEESAHILLRLLNDILDFSKIEAGKLELECQDFRISECVARASQMLALRAAEKGLEMACRVSPEIPDHLRGDCGRLQQVLVNLLSNAVKFTDAGEVLLDVNVDSITPDTVCLHFTVRDTGIGIPADKQGRIFRPFEQAEESTTRRFGGTGLGLTISGQLVEMMQGRIWVESEFGCGSTFHFTAQFKISLDQHQHAPTELTKLKNLRVLVVDDNHTNRRILSEMLQYWQMQPIVADSAAAARRALQNADMQGRPVRLILLDHHMPGEDGFQFAESVCENLKQNQCPVMMISSGSTPVDAEQWQKYGISRFMTKPVIAAELLNEMLHLFGQFTTVVPQAAAAASDCLIQPRRILLVEDNEINRRVALGLLHARGHQVVVAENGKVAVDTFDAHEFDVILMDMQMPVMDGYEATASIRNRERQTGGHIPIVAMTAEALKGDRERCLEAGMDDYVAKPIVAAEMYQAIEQFPAVCLASDGGHLKAARDGSSRTEHASDLPDRVDLDTSLHIPSEAVAAEISALPKIDWKGVKELLACGIDELHAFVELVEKEIASQLAEVRSALVARDSKLLRRSAHSLKGSVNYFGDEELFQAAFALERSGREESFEGTAEQLATLEREVARFLAALAIGPPDSIF